VSARKISELVAEAKAKAKPYDLELSDGTLVSVPPVSVDSWEGIGAADSSSDVLRVLAPDHAQAIIDDLKGAPAVVLRTLTQEMVQAFGLGN
jgi:hypothetical protein